MARYVVVREASVVTIEARSSLHPIRRSGPVDGDVDVTFEGEDLDISAGVAGRLELRLDDLSGDGALDREIANRVDSARYPVVVAQLQDATPDRERGSYRMSGLLSFHGHSRTVDGVARVQRPDESTFQLDGTMTLDIRA